MEQPKALRFICQTSQTNYCGRCEQAILIVTQDRIKEWLDQIQLLRDLKNSQKDLYEMYYWGAPAVFGDIPAEEEDTWQVPDGCEWIPLEREDYNYFQERTECEQTIIREDEVLFLAIAKHTDIYIYTATIQEDTLHEWKRRLEKQLPQVAREGLDT